MPGVDASEQTGNDLGADITGSRAQSLQERDKICIKGVHRSICTITGRVANFFVESSYHAKFIGGDDAAAARLFGAEGQHRE